MKVYLVKASHWQSGKEFISGGYRHLGLAEEFIRKAHQLQDRTHNEDYACFYWAIKDSTRGDYNQRMYQYELNRLDPKRTERHGRKFHRWETAAKKLEYYIETLEVK